RDLAGPGADAGLRGDGPERAPCLRHDRTRRRSPGVRAWRGHDRLSDLVGLSDERGTPGRGRLGRAAVLLRGAGRGRQRAARPVLPGHPAFRRSLRDDARRAALGRGLRG
ncbi:hypothetical protein PHISP_08669, partial [Aspergillus sp. HF37]